MQDPTPLKLARADEGSMSELRMLLREDIEKQCIAAAYLVLGMEEEARQFIMDEAEPVTLRVAKILGIDVQARIDYHATRIQEGG